MLLVLCITLSVVGVQIANGILSGSLALLAGHMLIDAAGVGIALLASHITMRPATDAPRPARGRRPSPLLLAVGVSPRGATAVGPR